MSLSSTLDVIRKQAVENTPPETTGVFQNAMNDLSRSGIVERSLKVGDAAPDFELPNIAGQTVRLRDLLAKGPVVVSFYRGGWCPFCTAELKAFQNALPAINAQGATMVAISPQTPDRSLATARQQDLDYELLSDEGNTAARTFGIVFHLADELQAIHAEFGLDLPEYNGDDSFDLPVPATYVVDTGGIIRLAFVDPNYTRRLDPAEVLSTLRMI